MAAVYLSSEMLSQTVKALWSDGLLQVASEARYPDPQLTLQGVRSLIEDLFKATLINVLHEHNQSQPIALLPVEILGEIFSFVPVKSRPSISLACKRWNGALYSSPSIWDNVVFDSVEYGSAAALGSILDFSSESPLHLSVHIHQRFSSWLCETLGEHIGRCVTLKVEIGSNVGSSDVTWAMAKPAPLLRKLWFYDQSFTFNRELSPDKQLFGNIAPKLHLIKLKADIRAFAGSATVFRNVERVMFYPSSPFNRGDIEGLCHLIPNAKELSIVLDKWDEPEHPERQPPVRLPSGLRSLVVVATFEDSDVRRFMRTIRWEHIPSIRIEHDQDARTAESGAVANIFYRSPIPQADSNGPLSFQPQTMSFEDSLYYDDSLVLVMFAADQDGFAPVAANRNLHAHERCDPGVERIITDIDKNTILSPSLFAQVRRMSLSEKGFDPDVFGQPIPPMPELIELTIYLDHSPLVSERSFCGGFPIAWAKPPGDVTSQRSLECPALRTLRIALGHRRSTTSTDGTLTPEMVIDFVTAYLKYREKLELLQFWAVQMVVVDPANLERMLQLAVQTEWEERRLAWRYKTSDLLYWN